MTVPLRAALYLRVSTARQAEHDVSIPDQRKQGEAYCLSRGLELVETFVEAGASATNDRRPEFQRMIEAGTSKPAPFDVVVVHSFSRFFRDHFELEFYVRKLAKNGVKLLSITQEMGDDPMHVMMRQIMALFDEYQSKENAKHVLRALKENARQGFWNGSLPPIGYRVVAAEQRGAKVKKKLEIDPLHADTVRLAFKLALEGDGTSGPMGVKTITKHLNERRICTRDGGRWGIGTVHRMLTRATYAGRHEFNKRGKSKELKPADEVIAVEVPPIIDQATFDAVQAHLKSRSPKVAHPQVVGGPTLLTGLIYCGKCGGAMTIRTGKGGRYRYYTCSMKARQGATACEGMTVAMERLDDLVAGYLSERLLDPDRLEDVLSDVLDRRQERSDRRREHIAQLNRRASETELRLKRLYDAIESGIADLDDPALKDRIDGLKATRDQARADSERASALLHSSAQQAITPTMLHKFASTARRRIRVEGGGYRRDHLRALAQRVEVDRGEVRIMGSKSSLLRLLSANGVATAAGGVPTVVPKWRSGRDSNPRYAFDVYSLSRRAPSTTRPPLRRNQIVAVSGVNRVHIPSHWRRLPIARQRTRQGVLYFLAQQLFDRVMTLRRRAALLAPFIAILPLAAADAADPPATPSAVVAQAPASAWRAVPAQDLLVMTIEGGKRVLIQLAPQFGPRHVANIRALATAHWWDGTSINRVQDNYVVQWGDATEKKPLPAGLAPTSPADYVQPLGGMKAKLTPLPYPDPYARATGFIDGWPVAIDGDTAWLPHCYGMIGVGRNMSPDAGTGAELYTVIGQAPRQLDRNIAVVGRIVEGMTALTSLPRGSGELGFYTDAERKLPIISVRLASDLPQAEQPHVQVMDTGSASFADYLRLRANRKDDFYDRPAGGVDLCNAPVPVRLAP